MRGDVGGRGGASDRGMPHAKGATGAKDEDKSRLVRQDMRESSVRSGIFIGSRPRNASLKLRQERHVRIADMPLLTELGRGGGSTNAFGPTMSGQPRERNGERLTGPATKSPKRAAVPDCRRGA